MAQHWGEVLRSLRQGAGVSLAEFAAATRYSKPQVSNVEAGRKTPTAQFVAASDLALGTTPLLALLHAMEGGDDVKRRAFLNAAGMMAGTMGFGSQAMAEVVRSALLDSAGEVEDWDRVVADFTRQSITDPGERFGSALMAQVVLVRHQMAEKGRSPERLRAAARLGQLYGLWLGDAGEVPTAHSWYQMAGVLAGQSGDGTTEANINGRTLSRRMYEGATAKETLAGVHRVLAVRSEPCPGFLESHSALVTVHALTGNLSAGRGAVRDMEAVAEHLDSDGVASPAARAAHYKSYLECRIGSLSSATNAYEAAAPALRGAPVWAGDAKIYLGLAHVRAGHVQEGIELALEGVTAVPNVKILRIGVQDVVQTVPRQHRSEELTQLQSFAATGPAPWETV